MLLKESRSSQGLFEGAGLFAEVVVDLGGGTVEAQGYDAYS